MSYRVAKRGIGATGREVKVVEYAGCIFPIRRTWGWENPDQWARGGNIILQKPSLEIQKTVLGMSSIHSHYPPPRSINYNGEGVNGGGNGS